jgi:hypothetical protein
MMKAFVASRVSGEERESLIAFLREVDRALRAAGIEPYITELSASQPDDGQKLQRAFRLIDESEVLVVIYKPGLPSEGMSAEVGYAYGRKPVWIFAQEGSASSLFALADKVVYWSDETVLMHDLEDAV